VHSTRVERAVDVEIGLKTLIVGPSLSGKTSILNNIEHALCGGCSDVMGREWTTEKGMLLALAPSATEAPASQVTDLRYENGHLTFKVDGGSVKFSAKGKSDGSGAPFAPEDAQRFMEAVQAAKARQTAM
jgi:hypothetical protein